MDTFQVNIMMSNNNSSFFDMMPKTEALQWILYARDLAVKLKFLDFWKSPFEAILLSFLSRENVFFLEET